MDARDVLLGDALGAEPLGAVCVRAPGAHRADVAGRRLERHLERRNVELVVVREDADDGALVDRGAPQELVGPLDDELVHVGEAVGSDELRAGVADGDAVAEEAPDGRDCGRVVDGAEDVHVRPGREGGDEDLALGGVQDRRLASGEEVGRRAFVLGADEAFRAGVLARDRDLEGDRPLLPDGLGDRRDQLRVELVHEDVHRTAARKAYLEGLLVRDAVGLEPRLAARQHLAGLAVDGRLDAAARHRAGDRAVLGHGQNRAGLARSRPLGADHGRDGDRGPVGGPALEGLENVSHGALRPL